MPYYRYERGSDEGVADAVVHTIVESGRDTLPPDLYRDWLSTNLHPHLFDWLLDPTQAGVEPGHTFTFSVHDVPITITIESRDTLRIQTDDPSLQSSGQNL